MNKKVLIEKGIITFVGLWIGKMIGMLSQTLMLLGVLMLVDYISGMLAAKKEALEHQNDKNYGWSSKKSIMGIYKKVGCILTILVAISADYLIYKFEKEMGIEVEKNTIFGFLVTVWFIINELLSILENVGRMGVELPEFIKNILMELRENIENK